MAFARRIFICFYLMARYGSRKDNRMFGESKFKDYLASGGEPECLGVPKGLRRLKVASSSEDASTKVSEQAKTLLSKTLSQHDKQFHKDGYKEGDTCNFRVGLMRGDDADDLAKEERKEGDVKFGFVKFTEDNDGTKKIMGVEEVSEAMSDAIKDEDEISQDESIASYLKMVGCGKGHGAN